MTYAPDYETDVILAGNFGKHWKGEISQLHRLLCKFTLGVWLEVPNIQSNSFDPLSRHQRHQRRTKQRVAADKLIDHYCLRFQLEFNFRNAKQYWG